MIHPVCDFAKYNLAAAGLFFLLLGCASQTATSSSSAEAESPNTANSTVSSQKTFDDVIDARQQEMIKKMSRQNRPLTIGPGPLRR